MCAKLKNVFVSTIFNAKYLKQFKTEQIFRKTIEDLNLLSTVGMRINVNGSSQLIFFQYIQILGDNLGQNAICGFSECFKANYFVEFVLLPISKLKKW